VANIIRRIVRSAKGRIKRDPRDRRTWALHDAALRRLATKDYEQISIAEISRGAGCSVGAFYGRFRDKDMFLRLVAVSAFHSLTDDAKRDLDPAQWRDASRTKIVDGIVCHVVNQMSRGKAAGVTRATVKLGMSDPDALEPLIKYRASVADCAVALLVPRRSFDDAARSVRIAVQMIFGIVTDATLQNAGPLRAGSRRMVDSLSDLMTSYLKLPAEKRSAGSDDEQEAQTEPEPRGAEEPGALAEDTNDQMAAPKADTRAAAGTVMARRPSRRHARGRDSAPSLKHLPVEDVKRAKPPEPIAADERKAKTEQGRTRRVRPI